MKFYKYLIIVLLISILTSCEETPTVVVVEAQFVCDVSDIEISDAHKIAVPDDVNPILWEGTYTNETVEISYTQKAGSDGETETLTFVFNKKGDCIQLDHAYKYYYGAVGDISAITEMSVFEFKMKDWEIDKKFTGQLIYKDHHDKQTYTINFWVEFTEDDYEIVDTNYTYFSDCLLNKLPINIDVDKDGTDDYAIIYELGRDTGNNPQYNYYEIKLVSTDEEKNEILALKDSKEPYPIIFEAPFSTEDTRTYPSGIKNTLEVFYEFDAPYEKYNFFLNNNLTYKNTLKNDQDDYFLVKMNFGDKKFYGWIKFKYDVLNCDIAILETYLNPIETKHVSIDN
ncbi:hypothetical protein [uncultured Polaribacter sp.]|uniref:hypothetical protein n=1 Tax=uncultured Polaribacter sp. TaxID=174711 RepID=UPI0030DCB68B|tara:strand:- start:18915 stop:19937 length:1023 start_codon:yes stop_codon:yes gene_type:complete